MDRDRHIPYINPTFPNVFGSKRPTVRFLDQTSNNSRFVGLTLPYLSIPLPLPCPHPPAQHSPAEPFTCTMCPAGEEVAASTFSS